MLAVVVEGETERRLALAEAPEPSAAGRGLLVKIAAISLNRGEVKGALTSADAGFRPGWDFAGTVEQAPEGCGFIEGERVVGALSAGAWAEKVLAAPQAVARIPKGVSLEQAAALPVAGLTALIGLSKRDSIAGRRVLISAATGGVGLMAVQIAARAGATVVALVRDDARAELLKRLGASTVVSSLSEAEAAGPYDLILEGLGGETLGAALGWLASRGICVLFGDAAGGPVTFDPDRFRHGPGAGPHGGTTLYGLFLGEEMTRTQPAEPLGRLLSMVGNGELDPMISVTAPWTTIDTVARDLLARRYIGKAVLTLT